jgi:tetratricopeptide (TPR) repeat protein
VRGVVGVRDRAVDEDEGQPAEHRVAGHLLIGLTSRARQYRDAMLRWLALILVYGAIAHADNAAHAGGLVVGAGVAWLLDRGGNALRREQARRDVGPGLDVLLVLAVVAGGFALAARHRDEAVFAPQLVNKAINLARAGKKDEAIALYKRAIELEPDDEIAHFDLAIAYCSQKRWAECEAEARIAQRLNPDRKETREMLDELRDLKR